MAKEKGTQDRPYWSAVVADGDDIKLRIQAERQLSLTPVHCDWVRFTVLRRNCPLPSVDKLFPMPGVRSDMRGLPDLVDHYQTKVVNQCLPLNVDAQDEFQSATEAHDLASSVCVALGSAFTVFSEPKKGMDFYKFRWSIELNGSEVGWVGYLAASGNGDRQAAQDKTIHVNLHGMACTFADHGWRDRLADICDDHQATLTRCDLALDFFDGLAGGIESIVQDYRDGLTNIGGRKIKSSLNGDWLNGNGRSIYLGSREAGKVTNAYEKGDQLYGEKFASEWLRVELRYGNKHRVLPVEMLRRPADFFAGASDWHASMLLKADSIVKPEPVRTTPRLEIETIEAEAARNVAWFVKTAGPTIANAMKFFGDGDMWDALQHMPKPARLKKFSDQQLQAHMPNAFQKFMGVIKAQAADLEPQFDTDFQTVESSPAFA